MLKRLPEADSSGSELVDIVVREVDRVNALITNLNEALPEHREYERTAATFDADG